MYLYYLDKEESNNHLSPVSTNAQKTSQCMRRKMSIRVPSGARSGKCRRSSVANNSQVQLLSIPQLDAIQRSLKLLDVRLQHIQTKGKDDERTKDDIEHIRMVMSENQKALSTVVTVLSSIQEEVRSLSIMIHKQQQNTLTIQPHSLRKKSNTNDHKDRANSTISVNDRDRNREITNVLNMDYADV